MFRSIVVAAMLTTAAPVLARAGVKFAFGTDPGVARHGIDAPAFALLVNPIGMAPVRPIRTATVAAADLMAVSGSPLEDACRLERVDGVMHDGIVARPPENRRTAEEPGAPAAIVLRDCPSPRSAIGSRR